MSSKNNREDMKVNDGVINRRNMLLGGTTFAAASVLTRNRHSTWHRQQQMPAPPAGRPTSWSSSGTTSALQNISAYTPMG
jgi:hypothetical protein